MENPGDGGKAPQSRSKGRVPPRHQKQEESMADAVSRLALSTAAPASAPVPVVAPGSAWSRRPMIRQEASSARDSPVAFQMNQGSSVSGMADEKASTSKMQGAATELTRSLPSSPARTSTMPARPPSPPTSARGGRPPTAQEKAALQTSARPLRSKIRTLPKECSPIKVRVNHYEVSFKRDMFPKVMYHYDVAIKNPDDKTVKSSPVKGGKDAGALPDRMLTVIWRKFELEKRREGILNTSTPFDGKKNFYSPRKLPLDSADAYSCTMEMDDPDDPNKKRRFTVQIKLAGLVNTDALWSFLSSGDFEGGHHVITPQDIIQGLDVALRDSPSRIFIACNRSFFKSEGSFKLDDLLELYFGHYQSLFLGCDGKATLNVDLATKAFYKEQKLEDFIRACCKLGPRDAIDMKSWKEFPESVAIVNASLKGKLIKYGTGKKSSKGYENYHQFTANGLVMESANSYTFTGNDGKKIDIERYMRSKGTMLEHPEYPVVHIGKQNMTNYVPLELCSIIPQPYKGKMENTLTSAMIKGSAQAPEKRFGNINLSRNKCGFEACSVLKEFGIQVGNKMLEVQDSYRLHPPNISTRQKGANNADSKTQVHPQEGKWGYKDRNGPARQFVIGAKVPKFAVVDCSGLEKPKIDEFLRNLSMNGEDLGMRDFKDQAKRAKIIIIPRNKKDGRGVVKPNEINYELTNLKKEGVELVIVIMRDGAEYATVKAEAEVKVGILTACILQKNVTIIKPQTISNYLLKLNSKLNGQNFTVQQLADDFLKHPTMILGADVTHPSPNSTAPSIAAVTASFNMSAMGYEMTIQPQESRQELIINMGNILEKFLKDYYKVNKMFPTKIIMFRDGVSEGYFHEIKAAEYEPMKKTCEVLIKTPVDITFVIVKKRHHTRFQPMDKRDSVGRFENIPPGTVVDTKIVHPIECEYFLNSHVGIQGTSKPTRYHVIHDDSKMSVGDLTRLTYFLCYGFVRCTQPVSYPAATYYAHLAAYRARHLLEREGSENADLKDLARKLTIQADLHTKYPMFFV